MRWIGKISLFLIFFLIPDFSFSFSKSQFCSLVAWGENLTIFGTEGKDGQKGKDGEKGSNLENITIFADGSPLNLDLAGEQGFSGENGIDGVNSLCDIQPANVANNLKGANGGDGGDGGNGGDGGDGASLTIYTTNKNNLQSIFVNAIGGVGGAGGNAGNGGDGCECQQVFWNLESCSGDPNSPGYSCSTKEYTCTNGETGKNGRSGRIGRQGKIGSLTLINSNSPLSPDRLSASISMAELKDRGLNLSKNIWETRTGATSFFAPNSVIADQYLELVERIEKSVVLIWNAPQSFQPFANSLVTLQLQEDQSVIVNIPENIWLESSLLERNNIVELFIFNILKQEDATRLKSTGVSGYGLDLQLELYDEAELSDIINTQFKIKYRISRSSEASYRPIYDYITKYEGEIAPQFVRKNGNSFTLDLGQLPIDPKFLEKGTAIELQLEAMRTFNNNQANQKFTIRHILGSNN